MDGEKRNILRLPSLSTLIRRDNLGEMDRGVSGTRLMRGREDKDAPAGSGRCTGLGEGEGDGESSVIIPIDGTAGVALIGAGAGGNG
ncbi:hypothetical protein M378DRAFT_162441 [Amanita muscaria Koide BX008]|uniref:Uncharacterized protein n=1 Tax=Amanita muscaria (strain Koide BX008) TaxID=946122 RepID=A0A0C2TEC2_AMAMK|nr:hypothetical protein M378DRAFT_162441 [Amanita muscaria Koide BX008]